MASSLPVVLAAEGGGLTDINGVLFLATLVLFGLFAFVVGRFGWKPLLKLVAEREAHVREAVAGAEKANQEARTLLEKHKEMVREAGREREEIIKRSLQDAEAIKADLVAKARAEGDALIARTRDQVQREKAMAIQELRSQVADLAVEAAGKIVKSSMSPDAQRKLVAEFISELPKA